MKHLYVAWQDEDSREWVPVARLDEVPGGFALSYTRGAKRSKGFGGLGRMSDFDKSYVSDQLFPFFANRIISKTRPEYAQYLKWLGLDALQADPISILAVSGGLRATDSYEIIQAPERVSDGLRLNFFCRGLRHMPHQAVERVSALDPGAHLLLMRDFQNPVDPLALALRTEDPKVLVGYLPRYYSPGVIRLLDAGETVKITVSRVNEDAPLDVRLLCTLEASAPADMSILEYSDDFLPATSIPRMTEELVGRTAGNLLSAERQG